MIDTLMAISDGILTRIDKLQFGIFNTTINILQSIFDIPQDSALAQIIAISMIFLALASPFIILTIVFRK